ncbi:MAG TPA: hypothetical protein VMS17_14930 [Gemmataceae bacterium]|nr:hypothetical protein [Gemmataceae bacterium]
MPTPFGQAGQAAHAPGRRGEDGRLAAGAGDGKRAGPPLRLAVVRHVEARAVGQAAPRLGFLLRLAETALAGRRYLRRRPLRATRGE